MLQPLCEKRSFHSILESRNFTPWQFPNTKENMPSLAALSENCSPHLFVCASFPSVIFSLIFNDTQYIYDEYLCLSFSPIKFLAAVHSIFFLTLVFTVYFEH